jgi:hypothetical protein
MGGGAFAPSLKKSSTRTTDIQAIKTAMRSADSPNGRLVIAILAGDQARRAQANRFPHPAGKEP